MAATVHGGLHKDARAERSEGPFGGANQLCQRAHRNPRGDRHGVPGAGRGERNRELGPRARLERQPHLYRGERMEHPSQIWALVEKSDVAEIARKIQCRGNR
eukprot:6224047-Pyramimonas_sp.AAC.1